LHAPVDAPEYEMMGEEIRYCNIVKNGSSAAKFEHVIEEIIRADGGRAVPSIQDLNASDPLSLPSTWTPNDKQLVFIERRLQRFSFYHRHEKNLCLIAKGSLDFGCQFTPCRGVTDGLILAGVDKDRAKTDRNGRLRA